MEVVIAHAADISQPSGGTERVSAFAEGLSRAGHDVTLVIPQPADQPPRRLDPVQIRTVSINHSGVVSQPVRGWLVMRRAKRLADDRGARLQIEHSTLAGLGTVVGVQDFVLDMHDLAHPSPIYGELPAGTFVQQFIKHMEKRGLRAASDVIVVSDTMKELVAETLGVSTQQFKTIPNGYDPDVTSPAVGVETVPGRVVFLGTLHPKISLPSVRRISRSSNVSELIIVGDGPMRDRLSDIDNDTVQVMGHLPDSEAFRLVASAEVAINPQHVSQLQRASSPVKIYYYAAAGVAMVLTEGPEIVQFLGNRDAATVVSEGGDFAGAVRKILDDESLRSSMEENARELATEFRWSDRVSDLCSLYN